MWRTIPALAADTALNLDQVARTKPCPTSLPVTGEAALVVVYISSHPIGRFPFTRTAPSTAFSKDVKELVEQLPATISTTNTCYCDMQNT